MTIKKMNFANLLTQIETVTAKKTYDNDDDTNFWKPTKDKAGNGTALIRFLPNKNIEDFPFVRLYHFGFKNPATNRWYIENSPSTLGQPDYLYEENYKLYQTKLKEDEVIAKARGRKLSHISNILVVKDMGNPDNDGKVMKFKYGTKIFDKLVAASKGNPELGVAGFNPWDAYTGANFLLKVTKVLEFPNYDSSQFAPAAPLFDGDEKKIQAVYDQCFDLNEEIAPNKFKSYEDLKKKFLWVMGEEDTSRQTRAQKEVSEAIQKAADPVAPKAESAKKAPPMPPMDMGSDDDDAALFASLLED